MTRIVDALKTATEKKAHKTAEATGEFIGNKVADKIVKPKLYQMTIQEKLKK